MTKSNRTLPKILRNCALAAILIGPATQSAFAQSSDIDFADTDGGTGTSGNSGGSGSSGGKARTITVNPSSGSTRTIQKAINKSRGGGHDHRQTRRISRNPDDQTLAHNPLGKRLQFECRNHRANRQTLREFQTEPDSARRTFKYLIANWIWIYERSLR